SGENPEYEKNLAKNIRKYISKGDLVVEIATGIGVTATIAARSAGVQGQVVSYEGDGSRVKQAKKVTKINNVYNRVT
ncbi:MAG: hypothetical protein ABEI86_02765, partial [Halobacteriaceae archaeon]